MTDPRNFVWRLLLHYNVFVKESPMECVAIGFPSIDNNASKPRETGDRLLLGARMS